jgi:hypothetical protein
MAITNHVVGGNSSDFSSTLANGGVYTELSQTADGSNGSVQYSITGQNFDASVAGNYNVDYSAEDDDFNPDVITDTVTVLPAQASGDNTEKFINGEEDRFGNDTTGTRYETTVQNPPADENQAGYFDENAFDPYELGNANANK